MAAIVLFLLTFCIAATADPRKKNGIENDNTKMAADTISVERLLPYLMVVHEPGDLLTTANSELKIHKKWNKPALPRLSGKPQRRALNVLTHYKQKSPKNENAPDIPVKPNDMLKKFQYKWSSLGLDIGLPNSNFRFENNAKLGLQENNNNSLLNVFLPDAATKPKNRLPRQIDRSTSNRSPVKKLVFRKPNTVSRRIGLHNVVRFNETNLGRYRIKRRMYDTYERYGDNERSIPYRKMDHPFKPHRKLTAHQEKIFPKHGHFFPSKSDKFDKHGHVHLERPLKEVTSGSKKRIGRSNLSREDIEFELALQRATDFCTELHTGDIKKGFKECIKKAVFPKAYLDKLRHNSRKSNFDGGFLDADYDDAEVAENQGVEGETAHGYEESKRQPSLSQTPNDQQILHSTKIWADRNTEQVADRLSKQAGTTGFQNPYAPPRAKGTPNGGRIVEEQSLLKYVQIKQALNNLQHKREP